MNRKTRNIVRIIAIVLVVLCVLEVYTGVEIPPIREYLFEVMLISFGIVLLVSK